LPPINCPSVPLAIAEENIVAKSGIEIYPNPSSGSFTIITSFFNENFSLQIFNLTGEVVYSSSLSGKEKRIYANLPEGIYFVKVDTGEKQFIIRQIIF
jgi:hypothetical protein